MSNVYDEAFAVNTSTYKAFLHQSYPIILKICCIPENYERRNSRRGFLSTCINVTLLLRCRNSMTTPILLQEWRCFLFYFAVTAR